MATLTSLRTLLVSALVAITPMTLVHAQHSNEYQAERVSFTFPADEEDNWQLEDQFFGSTWFFQAWTAEDSDSDEREECLLVESHPQDPENPISIDHKFVLFFGSDEPEGLSISLLADAPSDRLFLFEGGDLNSSGHGLVRLIVTPRGHHALAYVISDNKDMPVQLDEKWIAVLKEAELKSLKH